MNELFERIASIGIVPVVQIQKQEESLPLATALYQGGIDVAEITFRSEFAIDAIKQIHAHLPNMLLGAGTVSQVTQAQQAIEAGASFIVTPGFNHPVVAWCIEHNVPILPGVSTASEIETALSYGLHEVKFFPAQSSGGARKLKDLAAPYPQITFLPTGGIHATNMHEYLALPNVMAIGGSFMLPYDVIAAADYETIKTLSEAVVKQLLSYELIHIGINQANIQEAQQNATLLCHLFNFTKYQKPKSTFAGKGFEILHSKGPGEHGHIGIYTPYPQRALYHLKKKGIVPREDTITRNKKTGLINFVYLDLEIAGFGIHLIHPDVDMEV